jgi:hypothetical protein
MPMNAVRAPERAAAGDLLDRLQRNADPEPLQPREDLPRAVDMLLTLGFRVAGERMRVAQGRLEIQRLIRIEGRDLLPLDLLVAVDPTLDQLTMDRVSMPWEGRQIVVVGLASLRALKRLRGSAQDRADLEALGPDSA